MEGRISNGSSPALAEATIRSPATVAVNGSPSVVPQPLIAQQSYRTLPTMEQNSSGHSRPSPKSEPATVVAARAGISRNSSRTLWQVDIILQWVRHPLKSYKWEGCLPMPYIHWNALQWCI